MGVIMVRITVSGHPGSGTSTLVGLLEKHYSWTSINGGHIFREEAKRRGMTLEAFGQLCAADLEVDKNLDALLKDQMLEDAAHIFESRLSGWWAYHLEIPCIRIWVQVEPEIRATRVGAREGWSIDECLKRNQERMEVDLKRFSELYDLNPEDPTPYTHIIDCSNLNAQEVFAVVVDIVEGRK